MLRLPPPPGDPPLRASPETGGIAYDNDPWLGLVGVAAMRDTADVLEEHHVGRARAAGWTWAEIAAVLEVSPQAVHKRHARRLRAGASPGTPRA
jgi:hypothetical protein